MVSRRLLLCFGFPRQRAAFAETAEAWHDDRLQGILAAMGRIIHLFGRKPWV